MSGIKKLQLNKEFLSREYTEFKKSSRQIAREFGCGRNTVLYWIHQYGIDTRKQVIYGKEKPILKNCSECGLEFNARKGRDVKRALDKMFCSRKCMSVNRAKTIKLENHHGWKGGEFIRNDGRYLYRATYKGDRKYKKSFIHREVMEEHLGRKLERWEEVHHIDENRLNNDISNLEVLSKSEHAKLHGKQRNHLCGANIVR